MPQPAESSIKLQYQAARMTPELLKPVLDCLPRPEIRRRELSYEEATMPPPFRKLAQALREFSGEPFNTAILKRHDPGDPEADNPRLHTEDTARFGGHIALAGLIGQSHLIIGDPPHSIPFIVRSVVHLDAVLPYHFSPPETPEPRYVLLFGNVVTKPPNN